MHIYYKDKQTPLPHTSEGALLYPQYTEKHYIGREGAAIFAYDFHTRAAHHLRVEYPKQIMKMVFCFKGQSETYLGTKQQHAFSAGKVLLYASNADTYTSKLKADTHFQTVHLHLGAHMESQALQYLPPLSLGSVLELPIPANSLNLCQVLQHNCFQAQLQPLFVEKILHDQLFQIADSLQPSPTRLRDAKTLNQIAEAKHILEHSPSFVTTAELSKRVGMNTFKLKKLFKEQLHTTIFEYQIQRRLDKAYTLLLETQVTIAEAALHCGYESVGSFSNAFFRKFGLRPGALKNSR